MLAQKNLMKLLKSLNIEASIQDINKIIAKLCADKEFNEFFMKLSNVIDEKSMTTLAKGFKNDIQFVVDDYSTADDWFEKIFLRNILNCFGKQYRVVEYCDIPTELGFSYEIDMLIKTNLEWITFETFNRDYCLNKNLEKPLIVTEKDINEIGVTLFENNGYVSMEIFSNIKHISLTLIHGVLKCFGNYKILNIEEGDIKTGTIFVNTDLPIVVYGEPLGHITKQMINDYQNALKS